MEDPNVRSIIYDNLRREKIKLIDSETKETICAQQTALIGQKGEKIIEAGIIHNEDHDC